jgi:hypothetical protein
MVNIIETANPYYTHTIKQLLNPPAPLEVRELLFKQEYETVIKTKPTISPETDQRLFWMLAGMTELQPLSFVFFL